MHTHNASSIMEALRDLNQLEAQLETCTKAKAKTLQGTIEQKRSLVPRPILSHHDRIRARGRSSVAAVKPWVCTNCNIQVSRGLHSRLHVVTDLTICENCGSYLYLPEDVIESLKQTV